MEVTVIVGLVVSCIDIAGAYICFTSGGVAGWFVGLLLSLITVVSLIGVGVTIQKVNSKKEADEQIEKVKNWTPQ